MHGKSRVRRCGVHRRASLCFYEVLRYNIVASRMRLGRLSLWLPPAWLVMKLNVHPNNSAAAIEQLIARRWRPN